MITDRPLTVLAYLEEGGHLVPHVSEFIKLGISEGPHFKEIDAPNGAAANYEALGASGWLMDDPNYDALIGSEDAKLIVHGLSVRVLNDVPGVDAATFETWLKASEVQIKGRGTITLKIPLSECISQLVTETTRNQGTAADAVGLDIDDQGPAWFSTPLRFDVRNDSIVFALADLGVAGVGLELILHGPAIPDTMWQEAIAEAELGDGIPASLTEEEAIKAKRENLIGAYRRNLAASLARPTLRQRLGGRARLRRAIASRIAAAAAAE